MERVLGFDPGQNTGWACIEGGKVIDSGMIVYSDNRIDYIKKVMEVYLQYKPSFVGVESQFLGQDVHALIEIVKSAERIKCGVLLAYSQSLIINVAPVTVKSCIKAKKVGKEDYTDAKIRRVNEIFGLNLEKKQHDIASAIAIAYTAEVEYAKRQR